jgi:hypothetical protein
MTTARPEYIFESGPYVSLGAALGRVGPGSKLNEPHLLPIAALNRTTVLGGDEAGSSCPLLHRRAHTSRAGNRGKAMPGHNLFPARSPPGHVQRPGHSVALS